jgi:hypothetical protein
MAVGQYVRKSISCARAHTHTPRARGDRHLSDDILLCLTTSIHVESGPRRVWGIFQTVISVRVTMTKLLVIVLCCTLAQLCSTMSDEYCARGACGISKYDTHPPLKLMPPPPRANGSVDEILLHDGRRVRRHTLAQR